MYNRRVAYLSSSIDDKVEQLLYEGSVGFMPADTIYGLSCLALNPASVERIYEIKGRSENKPLVVLAANPRMLDLLSISVKQITSVEKYWPGPLTLICDAISAPEWLHRGTQTLAVRIPAESRLIQLISRIGPIVSTSANPSGQPPAATVEAAQAYFGDKLDFYVNGGDFSDRMPSTIVKHDNGRLQVIRPGAVKLNEENIK